MRRHLGTLLKVILSLGLIVFVLAEVHLPTLMARLTAAHLGLVALAMLVFWLAMTINALKWYTLLRSQQLNVPFVALLDYTFVGFFFNNVLPANIGGDLMRGYGLTRYTERIAPAAASVILDRIIGLAAYMSTAAVAALVVVYVTGRQELRVLAWAAVAAVAVLAVLVGILLSRRLRRLIDRLLANTFLHPLARMWSALSLAFAAYRFQYRALAQAFGIGLLGIASTTTVNFILAESLGGGIPLLHVLLFTPLIALVLIVPISVGGLGLNQVAYPFFYGLVGVPYEHAVGLSLFIQAVQILCSLPGGVLWLRWRRRRSVSPLPTAPRHV